MNSQIFYDPIAVGLDVVRAKNTLEVLVKCPYHNETTPSAYFNIGSGLFHCFGCGEGRNVEQLAADLNGQINKVDYVFAINKKRNKSDFNDFNFLPIATDNEYLFRRGVGNDSIAHFQIRANNNSVFIPLKNKNGIIAGYQQRKTDGSFPKYVLHGDVPPLFPFDEVEDFLNSDRKVVFLVEGIFGVIRLKLLGFDAFSIIGSSKAVNAKTFIDIANSVNKRIITLFDNDEAGIRATVKLLSICVNKIESVIPNFEADSAVNENITQVLNSNNPKSVSALLESRQDKKEFISSVIMEKRNGF